MPMARRKQGSFFNGTWVSDYYAFLTGRATNMNIEALEDTELLLLSYDDMQYLYNKIRAVERFCRLIAESIYITTQKRNTSLLVDTPEERYRDLVEMRPEVVERVPQYLITQYSGIQPESLSRIRKRMLNKRV